MRKKTIHHISHTLLSGALLLSLASCINDNYLDEVAYTDGKVAVELSIQTRAIGSIESNKKEYVPGTEWENYVDFNGGDYRIYFFTNDKDDATATSDEQKNTLIAEFKPTTIYSTDLDTYTTYTMSGEVDESLIESLTNFKVVVLANWGENTYPEVTTSTTTIDDICNAQTAVFNAFVDNATGSATALMPSSSLHIPFFGLREYSGVTWKEGTMTRLSGDITLLRSVAKVEVILEPNEEQPDISFSDVSIVNYNAQGYCAPTGVYLRGDYDHNYTWADDFVDSLHLVNKDANGDGINDPDQTNHTIAMYKTTNSEGKETWTCYLTEYDNTSTDAIYSYISVLADFQLPDDEPYKIYFANYKDGSTTAYDEGSSNTSDRYDIYRNYLYRYHVTYEGGRFRVVVNKWENTYENMFDYEGETVLTENPDGDSGS